jgi:hypothetical protein
MGCDYAGTRSEATRTSSVRGKSIGPGSLLSHAGVPTNTATAMITSTATNAIIHPPAALSNGQRVTRTRIVTFDAARLCWRG